MHLRRRLLHDPRAGGRDYRGGDKHPRTAAQAVDHFQAALLVPGGSGRGPRVAPVPGRQGRRHGHHAQVGLRRLQGQQRRGYGRAEGSHCHSVRPQHGIAVGKDRRPRQARASPRQGAWRPRQGQPDRLDEPVAHGCVLHHGPQRRAADPPESSAGCHLGQPREGHVGQQVQRTPPGVGRVRQAGRARPGVQRDQRHPRRHGARHRVSGGRLNAGRVPQVARLGRWLPGDADARRQDAEAWFGRADHQPGAVLAVPPGPRER